MTRTLYLVAAILFLIFAAWVLARGRQSNRALRVALAVLACAPWIYAGLAQLSWISETYLRFRSPWLLPISAAVSLYLLWRELPARFSPARRRTVLIATWALGTTLALVLAMPEAGRPVDRMAIVIAVDQSHSLDLSPGHEARVLAELEAAKRSMHEDDAIAIVHFASDARLQAPLRKRDEPALLQTVSVGRDATDLESGLRRALVEIPSDATGKVVVISDGVETRGNVLSAAVSAALAETPVDTLLIEQKKLPELRIAQVLGPKRALDEREPAELRIVTQSSSEQDAEVRIKRDGILVKRLPVRVAAGEDVIYARDTAAPPGMHRYDVEISALTEDKDGTVEDNSGAAFVRVKGRGVVLLVEHKAGEEAPTERALRDAGLLVDVRTPASMPQTLTEFVGYDLVVWGSIPAYEVAPTILDALLSYTRDTGGGLLLLGGAQSFGPGGYSHTPIEEAAPISFELKKDQRKASLAEVIAIDYSGSMSAEVSGKTKLALANEAAARSATLLNAGDRLGVAHVDTVVSWTVPLRSVSDPIAIGSAIRGVGVGGGGIYTDLALRESYAALRKESTNLKHVLLFADGSDAEQLPGCRTLVEDAFRAGVTTSVISLGKGSDTPELEVLSRLGKGRFYLIDDASRLPSVFTQETILATRSSFREEVFTPKLGAPSPMLKGLNLGTMPQLKGYTVAQAKPRAEVSLLALDGDPLLAAWSVGIGKSAAFTSDYHDRWGAAWLAWPEATTLFGQVARAIARSFQDSNVRVDTQVHGGRLVIRATAKDSEGRAAIHKQLSATVAMPDGTSQELTLTPVGAGAYGVEIPLSRQGSLVTTVKDGDKAVSLSAASFNGADELRGGGSNAELLAQVSQVTKGRARTSLAGLFDERGIKRVAYDPIDRMLLWVTGALLLFVVAARRLSLPDLPKRKPATVSVMPAEAPSWLARRAEQKQARQQAPPPDLVPKGAPLAGPAPIAPEPISPAPTPEPDAPERTPAAHTALSLLKKKRDKGNEES
jgi:Ca-activated chloride channel homolog